SKATPLLKTFPPSYHDMKTILPSFEMYGEPFDIPNDGKIVFMSWYEGGNVFRSGVAFERDRGRIFYFSPGHELYPIYHDPIIQKVILNAIRWAAPIGFVPDRVTPQPEAMEKITTENPRLSISN
ncbi:MAG: ThuA domain-containing protein, partial [bacterium]|nr:ThuA domain-containing protein [bacterium]